VDKHALAFTRTALNRAEREGIVRSWYCYSPDGARRWIVEWVAPLGERSYSSREAWAVAEALTCAREIVAEPEPA
jgi:hypothetical protein